MDQKIGSFECESCGTIFDNEEEFLEHEKYSKYRRKTCCWQ
ncbi:MAG: hypothetical protein ACPKPY_10040 [Nitrososphaeraceae archaeon]